MAEIETSEELFRLSQQVIPGGVNSPVRAFGSVGGTPRFMAEARGAFLRDADGSSYIDFVGGWGPALLGHAHPEVVAAVQQAAAKGLSFGTATESELRLVELIIDRVHRLDSSGNVVRPLEKLRLVSTGTEATMTAIRLARGATGRDVIVKFAGNYHGHVDALLAEAGSGLATFALPGSAGVTAATANETIVLPYNDIAALEEVFAERGDQIAAVIAEAAPANIGVVAPLPGFNAAIAALTHKHGSVFILDEVLTGFRASSAGWWAIDGEGWQPDLFTFGKVVGGGLPAAAVGGRAELMDLLAPLGPVYQAGTLSGNPLAVAAGITTLEMADDASYDRLAAASTGVQEELKRVFAEQSVPAVIPTAGTLFSVFFGEQSLWPEGRPLNYEQTKLQNSFFYGKFFQAMLAEGVYLPPSSFEAWFVSAAHDDEVLELFVEALSRAVRRAQA